MSAVAPIMTSPTEDLFLLRLPIPSRRTVSVKPRLGEWCNLAPAICHVETAFGRDARRQPHSTSVRRHVTPSTPSFRLAPLTLCIVCLDFGRSVPAARTQLLPQKPPPGVQRCCRDAAAECYFGRPQTYPRNSLTSETEPYRPFPLLQTRKGSCDCPSDVRSRNRRPADV